MTLLLDWLEDTPHAHFILCTAKFDKIDSGIKARARCLLIGPPTFSDAYSALRRIAEAEAIGIDEQQLKQIVDRNRANPRNCLKDLQYFRTMGKVPPTDTATLEMDDSPFA